MPDVLHVSSLSLQPRRLWSLIGVRATFDNSGNPFSEFALDISQPLCAAAVFYCVVQQRRDRFRLVRAVLHCDRGDSEDVRNVGNPGLLPEFAAVNSRGVNQRFLKLPRQAHAIMLAEQYAHGRTAFVAFKRKAVVEIPAFVSRSFQRYRWPRLRVARRWRAKSRHSSALLLLRRRRQILDVHHLKRPEQRSQIDHVVRR